MRRAVHERLLHSTHNTTNGPAQNPPRWRAGGSETPYDLLPDDQDELNERQIDYDPQAATVYIRLRTSEVGDTTRASRNIYVDVDADGVPSGVGILFVGRLLAHDDIARITVSIGQRVC